MAGMPFSPRNMRHPGLPGRRVPIAVPVYWYYLGFVWSVLSDGARMAFRHGI